MKKAEIIKNGNVNLEPVKLEQMHELKLTTLDDVLKRDDKFLLFLKWKEDFVSTTGYTPSPEKCFNWCYDNIS